MKNYKSTIYVLLAGILWGIISIFVRHLSAIGFSSFSILTLRSVFAVLIMSIFFLVTDKSLFKIKIRDVWYFLGTGILSLTFFSFCYFTTILSSGAAIAVVLLYTSPIFVLILSAILFKEKITGKKIVALVFTFVGCVLVAGLVSKGNSLSITSLLIGLGAGFGYALYSIFSRLALKKYKPLTITFYTFVFSGISTLPFLRYADIQKMAEPSVWFYVLGIALVCTVLPYIFYTYGLSKMETSKAAIIVTIEPLVGCLLGIFAWGEPISFQKILGIVLIFVSIVILNFSKKA